MNYQKLCLSGISLLLSAGFIWAQSYTLELNIRNQPEKNIILGKVKGDDFIPIDTIVIEHDLKIQPVKINYRFKEGTTPGIYRLIFGQTTYAKVMEEPPQQLDFIFNNENLILETDFNEPVKSLVVVLSEENRVWYEFLWKEQMLQAKIKELELELDHFRRTGKAEEAAQRTEQFNQLQNDRHIFISQLTERNAGTYAAKMISMFHEPFTNGFLTREKRREIFQREFFNQLDFTDESLINSSVYTDKIFYFLSSFNQPGYTKEQLEEEYIGAMDLMLDHVSVNPQVYDFVRSYLLHGFEVLEMKRVQDYIINHQLR